MDASSYRLVVAPTGASRKSRFLGRTARTGLRGLLADTNRVAAPADVPAKAASGGFAWAPVDQRSRRWWPQGITTSAEAYGAEPTAGRFEGNPIILVSWYAHGLLGYLLFGSRISVIDWNEDGPSRYRNVLLVAPKRWLGLLQSLRPVRVHAGGIVWYGEHLYVAGGAGGIRVFRLDDLVRVRNRVRTRGYRYVLPQLTSYDASHDEGVGAMMYSFMSIDRAGEEDHLVAGEYGTKGGSHRLMSYPIDRDTELLRSDDRGWAVPAAMWDRQIERMQGACVVDGTWVITSSMGEGNPGDLWVGSPGDYQRHRAVLPTGPEDITYWPQQRRLWSVTEYPQRRWVYSIDADRWLPERKDSS